MNYPTYLFGKALSLTGFGLVQEWRRRAKDHAQMLHYIEYIIGYHAIDMGFDLPELEVRQVKVLHNVRIQEKLTQLIALHTEKLEKIVTAHELISTEADEVLKQLLQKRQEMKVSYLQHVADFRFLHKEAKNLKNLYLELKAFDGVLDQNDDEYGDKTKKAIGALKESFADLYTQAISNAEVTAKLEIELEHVISQIDNYAEQKTLYLENFAKELSNEQKKLAQLRYKLNESIVTSEKECKNMGHYLLKNPLHPQIRKFLKKRDNRSFVRLYRSLQSSLRYLQQL